MQHKAMWVRGAASSVALVVGLTVAACSPASNDTGNSRTGGSGGGTNSGGSGGSAGGSSGSGGSASGGAGGGSASGGASGSGGSASGGAGGSASGGASGSGGSPADGGVSDTAGGGDLRPDVSADTGTPAAVSFTRVFTEILKPGCTGAGNACHNVVRDQYYHFIDQATAHRLLVPATPVPVVGTVPMRVNTLLSYVKPQNPNMPNAVRMPPQSGPNLGNPPTMLPPLTTAQVALIETWAKAGAKND